MFNFDNITKEDRKEHNSNQPDILQNPYGILIAGGFRSGTKNALFNLISHEPDIDEIYLIAKEPFTI